MNIFDYKEPQKGELFTSLLEYKNIKINRIVSSCKIEEKEYIQEEDEWLILIEGEATLRLDKEEKKLLKGETLFIPAKMPHKVLKTTQNTIWLTVHIF